MKTATRISFAILIFCAILFAGRPAHSGGGLRCGNKLVSVGDHRAQVYALCGEPDSVAIYYYHRYNDGPYHNHQDVQVTEYIYNFGPNKFMRQLRFVGGKLKSIELIGYGHN